MKDLPKEGREKDELWFICNETNAKKIIKVLLKHGLELTPDIWNVLPDMEKD